jgi:phage terminase large subunit GpA-like protein
MTIDKQKFYNSNSMLKAAGQKVQYTEDNVKEFLKCAEDPVYFISTYCKIVTLDHGLQPFTLYPCQINKINVIHNNRKVILMEGRQQGKTTTSAAYILWFTIFQANKTVAILANKASAAREVLARYQLMYEHLPKWIQQGVTTWNKGDIELENGSIVFTAATSASGIRGKSVNMLYVDETAIIPNTVADQFFASVYPTISAGETTKILLSSTPLGYNHFWKFWNDAEHDRNGFVPLFISNLSCLQKKIRPSGTH